MIALELAAMVACTEAEGPARRFALWVQGCTLGCPGCCNPEMFAPGRGRTVAIDALDDAIARAHAEHAIEGITVLGGEPLQQLEAVAALAERAAARGLGTIVFSGYTHAEARTLPGFTRLWAAIDTLVDGRFDATARDGHRRFIGSRNQQLIHRTARYATAALWSGAPTAELTFAPGRDLQIVGAPALARRVARGLTGTP